MFGQKNHTICTFCVMDTSDTDIVFDASGRCNHCIAFEKLLKGRIQSERGNLDSVVEAVKASGVGKKYDCLIGISGGVDSCYTVYLCHSLGLRPLVMHMDNGWNSEISVKNIRKLVEKLGIDYLSYVLDWKEFRDIQLGFLRSSLVDLEMPTDMAIPASLYQTAVKNNIKYILSGGNYSSEGILPLTWGYHVLKDAKLYRHIVKKYTNVKIKKTPLVGLWGEIYYKFVRGIKTVYPLNMIDYDKDAARSFLIQEYGWQDYGGKHHESKITGFWQSYAMPTKYNMDYRRATLSSQIVSGQVTRDKALQILSDLPYDPVKVESDKVYIAKKYGISLDEFNTILSSQPKTYKDFPNQKVLIERFYNLYRRYKGQL